MSYANFKPTVWSAHIQHELPRFTVFEQDCDYRFKGDVKKGSRVKILGVSRPTIGDYRGEDIGAPEAVPDTSVYLDVDQAKFFNFRVDDVDEAQSKEGLMAALMTESTRAMAEARDRYIAAMAKEAGKCSRPLTVSTPEEAKKAVDDAFVWLWENGVSEKDRVTIYLTPWFYNLFKNSLTALSTDNPEYIKDGVIGIYNKARVKMTNNCEKREEYDLMMIKTDKAVAFASSIDKVEAYRPQGFFADAVKGLNVYGGKVVRPKEMYVIKAKAGQEGE